MATEVELKYLVLNENVSKEIFNLLNDQQIIFSHQIKKLSNCYFDTPDLALRKMDMGLRIRSHNGHIEQTIKTAGVTIGGLHQRPEYNVDIQSAFPNLALFPQEIWPQDKNIDLLQEQIVSLFSTDFTREIWTITFKSSEIEMAFDNGNICSDGRSVDICEIELELLSGDKAALFELAKLLFASLKLRAGINSKAARGYRLFAEKENNETSTFEKSKISLEIKSDHQQVERYFQAGIGHCLHQLQLSIEQYLMSQQLTELADIVDVLSLIRHGFRLFAEKSPTNNDKVLDELNHFMQQFAWVDNAIYLQELMNKTGNYRKKLEYSEQLIEHLRIEKRRVPDVEMITELLHSERFNLLQLTLLQLLLNDSQTDESFTIKSDDNQKVEKNRYELFDFAKLKLSESLTQLSDAMTLLPNADAEHYLENRQLLRRSLLTGHWFGSLFDPQERDRFKEPWLDMLLGLRELQSLWIIKQQLEKLDTSSERQNSKIINWQHGKVDNLLLALEQTKQAALAIPPYWLI